MVKVELVTNVTAMFPRMLRSFNIGMFLTIALMLAGFGLLTYAIFHPSQEVVFNSYALGVFALALSIYQINISILTIGQATTANQVALLSTLYAAKQVMLAEETRDIQNTAPVPFSIFNFPNIRN